MASSRIAIRVVLLVTLAQIFSINIYANSTNTATPSLEKPSSFQRHHGNQYNKNYKHLQKAHKKYAVKPQAHTPSKVSQVNTYPPHYSTNHLQPNVKQKTLAIKTNEHLYAQKTIGNAQAPPSTLEEPNADHTFKSTILDVTINKKLKFGTVLLLRNGIDRLYVTKGDLESWRIQPDESAKVLYNGQSYYDLAKFPGLKYEIVNNTLSLNIDAPAKLFVDGQAPISVATNKITDVHPSNPGGYLNYDITAEDNPGHPNANGLFELGLFNNLGFGAASVLARTPETGSDHFDKPVRLNTAWYYDQPNEMKSWVFGDTTSNANNNWASSVSYGGIKWGTNYSTQPSFNKSPLPSARGEAVIPSTVDLFVNNAKIYHGDVQQGPFDVKNIPVVDGQGNVSLVTTDELGRQQVINIPYYTSSTLLAPGLHDYSYSAGFIRNNYTAKSYDYGRFMATGDDRFGINNQLTGSWRAELLRAQQTAGAGITKILFNAALFDLSAAASHNNKGDFGALTYMALTRNAFNGFNFGINGKFTTSNYRQLGFTDDQLPPRLQATTFIGFPQFFNYSLGLSFIHQDNRDTANSNITSVSISRSFFQTFSLSLTAMKNFSGLREKSIFLNLLKTIGADKTLSLSSDIQNSGNLYMASFSKSIPNGVGYGYSFDAQSGSNNPTQHGNFTYQGDVGSYNAQVAHQRTSTNYIVGTSGSLAMLNRHLYFSRKIDDSFAVVEVPGQKHVGVYSQNQLTTYTDKDGSALVPDLSSYSENQIAIEPDDLSNSYEIANPKMTVIPYYRSGVLVRFPVKSISGATLKIVDNNDNPIPEGALVTIKNGTNRDQFFVADDGETYMYGLEKNNIIDVRWQNVGETDVNTCSFELLMPKTDQLVVDLGKFICRPNDIEQH